MLSKLLSPYLFLSNLSYAKLTLIPTKLVNEHAIKRRSQKPNNRKVGQIGTIIYSSKCTYRSASNHLDYAHKSTHNTQTLSSSSIVAIALTY